MIDKQYRAAVTYTAASLAVAGIYAGTQGVLVAAELACLEIALSMDNASINAKTLRAMSEEWRVTFLRWGMPIAVIGMRLLFPLLIVSVASWVSPLAALRLALINPTVYGDVLRSAHVEITGFGAAFLLMLFFDFFFDSGKAIHWLAPVERAMVRLGHINAASVACTAAVLLAVSVTITGDQGIRLLQSGMIGFIGYIASKGVAELIGGDDETARAAAKAGIAGFIFLEVQDASFSFDGVIGALAVSNNMVLIALGLGIGAIFVRSITLSLVQHDTMREMLYLEHGAFWAVGFVAGLMLLKLHTEVPDAITGLAMATIIGSALLSSVVHNTRLHHAAHPHA